jgi:glycosyltransferase involved in cell wall biosynthesis
MIDISVVIPVYNAAKYVEKCVESLFQKGNPT